MVVYKDADGSEISMEHALSRAHFSVAWVDAVASCERPGFDEAWTVTRKVGGQIAGYGKVTRRSHAFYRNGSSNAYNTFDEAARRIINPV